LGLGFPSLASTAALVGALALSIVSFLLSLFVSSEQRHVDPVRS
jgi:hypothetical protein